eukprot:1827147-Amphidinium_carterae.1
MPSCCNPGRFEDNMWKDNAVIRRSCHVIIYSWTVPKAPNAVKHLTLYGLGLEDLWDCGSVKGRTAMLANLLKAAPKACLSVSRTKHAEQ